jgi:transposase
VKEAKVASEPEALVYFFKELGFPVNRIGFEAGPLSQWLHAWLTQAGFETVLLETRHVKAALSAMTVKTVADVRGQRHSALHLVTLRSFPRLRAWPWHATSHRCPRRDNAWGPEAEDRS